MTAHLITRAAPGMKITKPGLVFGMSDEDKFWARVEKTEGCWLWTGSKTSAGYGNLRLSGGRTDYAHRVAYRIARGEIPLGLVIDHLCRVRHCVRPEHLEPVLARENVRRGAATYGAVESTCKRGHDITDPDNVYTNPIGHNHCRTCMRDGQRRRRAMA